MCFCPHAVHISPSSLDLMKVSKAFLWLLCIPVLQISIPQEGSHIQLLDLGDKFIIIGTVLRAEQSHGSMHQGFRIAVCLRQIFTLILRGSTRKYTVITGIIYD